MMALGGDGVISTTSNVAPSDVVELVRSFRAGDLARSRDTYYRLLPLMDALFCETNPIPVKAALEIMGLIDGEIRLPLTPLGDAHRERLQLVLKDLGALG
jgi:4-hydroxy-tetrahydrodipicolinate synthase